MRIALQHLHRQTRNLPLQVTRCWSVVPLSSTTTTSSSSSASALHSTFYHNENKLSRPAFPVVRIQVHSFSSSAAAPKPNPTSNEEDDNKDSNKDDLNKLQSTTKDSTANNNDSEDLLADTLLITKQDIKVNKEKPWLWDMGLSSMFPEWKKMFDPATLATDVSAGITVGCVAVPLSLAIAVASGVPPEVGLVTAAVSGVAAGLMGGTTLAVTGPAAAISLLVIGAVQQHGLEALPVITLVCGGLQTVSGVTRLGVIAKLVPVSVIAGFTTGVGAMILSGQVPKALGLAAPAGLNPIETMAFLGEHVAHINPAAAGLALGTAGALALLPKLHPKLPSALLAVGGATLATHGLGLDVTLIGSIPSGLEAFQWATPVMPPSGAWPSLAATSFLIYAMTSAESLLSCAALEKMKKTSYRHNPDQELVGQGLANMGAAMFGGMPVTSVIARSSLNVKLNAESRLPALLQAGFVFSSVVFFSDHIATIPMPALSGMLIMTGIGMLNPAEFKHCFAVQKLDAIPFVTTIGGMIAFGLAEGIGIGCLSAWALNYDYGKLDIKEMKFPHKIESKSTEMTFVDEPEIVPLHKITDISVLQTRIGTAETENVQLKGRVVTLLTDKSQLQGVVDTLQGENKSLRNRLEMVEIENKELRGLFETLNVEESSEAKKTSKSTIGWQLKGPINFGAMFKIDDLMHRIEEMNTDEKVIVLDMQETTSIEFTGVEELVNRLLEVAEQNPGTTIQMWNCHRELQNALEQCDPTERIARHGTTASSDNAPFYFPPKEEEIVAKVPIWYDSPHYRPDK